MKSLLINQPGRHGDILICLPIAKYYSNVYDIDWLCPKIYHSNFRNINYCKPIESVQKKYDKVIDLSFGLNKNSESHKLWTNTKQKWQSFIILKYVIADVSIIQRWNLSWNRNQEREDLLYKKIIEKYGSDYIVAHEKTHDFSMNITVENKVLFEPIEDYNIFDWYKVLINSKEIHCIDSSLANFVEVISEFLHIPKFYYRTKKVPNIWDRTLLINNWYFIDGVKK